MSFVKLQDGRSTYALDSIRLRNQKEAATAPQPNTVELFMRDGILFQIDETGISQQIGIPVLTTPERLNLKNIGVIVYDKTEDKHYGLTRAGWQTLY